MPPTFDICVLVPYLGQGQSSTLRSLHSKLVKTFLVLTFRFHDLTNSSYIAGTGMMNMIMAQKGLEDFSTFMEESHIAFYLIIIFLNLFSLIDMHHYKIFDKISFWGKYL